MKACVVSLVLLSFSFSCKETPPEPPSVRTVELAAEDASCTEAWLKVSLTDANEPRTVALKRDGQTVQTLRLSASDSLLIDEGLLPHHSYIYQALRLRDDSTTLSSSSTVQLTTLDTTSHNWTFVAETLGVTSSVLYDVAIINDTLAYAVGEMYLRDSTGQLDPQAWNAAKWNGQRWELKRIPFVGSCSAVLYPPLKAIWAFSATNILVTNGGSIVRYDGVNATMDCGMNQLLAGAINKIYATSPQDVYAVGNAGTIVHYSSGTWRRLESGTTVAIQDIWGVVNSLNGQRKIFVAVCPGYGLAGTRLLRINENNSVDTVPWVSARGARSVWFEDSLALHVCGDGVFRREPDLRWREIAGITVIPVRTERLRGRAKNDLFVVGNYGAVAHFNGVSFGLYPEASAALVYTSLDFKGNQMVAVGYTSSCAIVLHVWR